jgi:hypothetical protein
MGGPHIDCSLIDPANGRSALVSRERALHVVNHGHPPVGVDTIAAIPYREYFTNSGSSDMAVNGSVTAVDFGLYAIDDHDVYVRTLSVIIGDGGTPALNKFGALSELANGVEISYKTSRDGTLIVHEGITTNLEFIRLGAATALAIGTGSEAFLADVSGGGTEKSYLPTIDLVQAFGLPWGLKLSRGSSDTLNFKVQDDLTGLITFNVIAYGIRIGRNNSL